MADDLELEGLDGEGTGGLAGTGDGSVRSIRDNVADEPSIFSDGGAGRDLLIGGAGRDLLIGGDGRDLLIGGESPRTFDPADFFALGGETSGESSDHKEWIDVTSMSWETGGASAPAEGLSLSDSPLESGGGLGGGRCQVQDFSIVKTLDHEWIDVTSMTLSDAPSADTGGDVQPDGFVWGLDRIDQDAGAPGDVFIAAVDVDGAKPHVFAFDLM